MAVIYDNMYLVILSIAITIILFIGLSILQFAILQGFCERMRRRIAHDSQAQLANLSKKVQGIEQQLNHLTQEQKVDPQRVQRIEQQLKGLMLHLSQVAQEPKTRPRTDNQILERLEQLEKGSRSGESRVIDRIHSSMPPKSTNRVNDESQQSLMASRNFVVPEEVAFSLLDLIEPAGRSSPLAQMAGLNDWLGKNHPSIEAEPLGALNQDLWRLVILTADRKTGIVVPALDSIVGPQESLKWFEGGRYDGTQALVRANVSVLAKAVRDEETQIWRPRFKGKIDLS